MHKIQCYLSKLTCPLPLARPYVPRPTWSADGHNGRLWGQSDPSPIGKPGRLMDTLVGYGRDEALVGDRRLLLTFKNKLQNVSRFCCGDYGYVTIKIMILSNVPQKHIDRFHACVRFMGVGKLSSDRSATGSKIFSTFQSIYPSLYRHDIFAKRLWLHIEQEHRYPMNNPSAANITTYKPSIKTTY